MRIVCQRRGRGLLHGHGIEARALRLLPSSTLRGRSAVLGLPRARAHAADAKAQGQQRDDADYRHQDDILLDPAEDAGRAALAVVAEAAFALRPVEVEGLEGRAPVRGLAGHLARGLETGEAGQRTGAP